jgi:FAD/FMN-containing dehydrogenase
MSTTVDANTGRSRLTAREISALAARLQGTAVHWTDPAHRSAVASRFANPEIEWDPDAVVFCRGPEDVQRAVVLASESELGVSIRGGGVGWVGAGRGTLLLDLRYLSAIRVEARRATVEADGGATWIDVARTAAPFALATAGPQFPRISAAGYALGGGHGWLTRKLGWAADTLRSVEIVTADGRRVRASDEREQELFWALRGAGHNFGVALALEFATLPLSNVHAGSVWFHPSSLAEVFAWYREWAPTLADEISTILGVMEAPAELGVQGDLVGRLCPHVLLCHCGGNGQAKRDLAELRGRPAIVADTIEQMPYWRLASDAGAFQPGLHRRSRMRYLSGLPDDVIDLTADRLATAPAMTMVSIHHYGGALARVGENATAMSHRGEEWNYMLAMTWRDDNNGAAIKQWQDDLLTDLAPWSRDSMYVNYLCQEPERVSSAYNASTWARLRDLKQTWDPDNRFSQNHNIPPAGVRG